jgi:hypothetical protein
MSAEKLYSEIFEDFEKAESRVKKIEVLRKHDHKMFRDFFTLLFDKKIQFDVEIPQYRPAVEPAGLNYTYLNLEIPKLYRFIVGHPRRTNVAPARLKSLLTVVLESLYKDEADLLVRLLKKDLKIKSLTPRLVQDAYPDWKIPV